MGDVLLIRAEYGLSGEKLSLQTHPSALRWSPALQAAAAHLLGAGKRQRFEKNKTLY